MKIIKTKGFNKIAQSKDTSNYVYLTTLSEVGADKKEVLFPSKSSLHDFLKHNYKLDENELNELFSNKKVKVGGVYFWIETKVDRDRRLKEGMDWFNKKAQSNSFLPPGTNVGDDHTMNPNGPPNNGDPNTMNDSLDQTGIPEMNDESNEPVDENRLSVFKNGYKSAILFAEIAYDSEQHLSLDEKKRERYDTSFERENFDADDFSPQAEEEINHDCEAFFRENHKKWEGKISDERAGADFWFSRQHHGTGFFDDGLDDLQKDARAYGTLFAYVEQRTGKITFS